MWEEKTAAQEVNIGNELIVWEEIAAAQDNAVATVGEKQQIEKEVITANRGPPVTVLRLKI